MSYRKSLGILATTGVAAVLLAPMAAQAVITPSNDATVLGGALFTNASQVTGGTLTAPSVGANAVSTTPLAGFPTSGDSYALLTSGAAELADDANTSGSTGVNQGGGHLRGDTDQDVSVLAVEFTAPAGVNCMVGMDFRFLSDEFPEYVGSSFNDAFIAELDASTWTTSGSAIVAPDNFAFDPANNPISINAAGVTSFDATHAVGTTYDGATPLLTAATPVTPGAHTLYLSIFDQGDGILDSAVMVDNLRFGKVLDPATGCVPGAQVVEYDFDGFFSPVEMDAINKAKAGQSVPLKWRLTDVSGTPVSDPAEIGGVRSYPVACDTLAGDPTDAVEEYASGGSGLQYLDDGNWQINWQTPASYANTCRGAYVEYGSGEVSPPAFFAFKK